MSHNYEIPRIYKSSFLVYSSSPRWKVISPSRLISCHNVVDKLQCRDGMSCIMYKEHVTTVLHIRMPLREKANCTNNSCNMTKNYYFFNLSLYILPSNSFAITKTTAAFERDFVHVYQVYWQFEAWLIYFLSFYQLLNGAENHLRKQTMPFLNKHDIFR